MLQLFESFFTSRPLVTSVYFKPFHVGLGFLKLLVCHLICLGGLEHVLKTFSACLKSATYKVSPPDVSVIHCIYGAQQTVAGLRGRALFHCCAASCMFSFLFLDPQDKDQKDKSTGKFVIMMQRMHRSIREATYRPHRDRTSSYIFFKVIFFYL